MENLTFEVTAANFQERVLGSDVPVLVDFWAEWCSPCKMISPLVEDIARKYRGRLIVGELDYDAHPEIGAAYQVLGLPTLILFRDGQEAKRIIGFRPQKALEAELLPYLEGVREDAG